MMTTSDVEDDRSPSASADESGGEQDNGDMGEHSASQDGGAQNGSKSTNAKDPLRPRRKKARRACYACQRAHLTCGDERPCQRCIKRGLQDACQDGVRKKAKYLHDAPTEALMPGVGGTLYNHVPQRHRPGSQSAEPQFMQSSPFQPVQPYPSYSPGGQMPPPMLQERGMSTASFGHQSPTSQPFNVPNHPSVSTPIPQPTSSIPPMGPVWNGTMFDPSDPALFNFDLASMNFGSHYGALEFGMLGHMATGAGETPESDQGTQRGSIGPHQYSLPLGNFGDNSNQAYGYGDVVMSDWPKAQGMYDQQMNQKQDGPNAFAIESNVAHFTSPDTDYTPTGTLKFDDSPTFSSSAFRNPAVLTNQNQNISPTSVRQVSQISTPQLKAKSQIPVKSSKRPRDPSSIYTSVTSPYPYTSGFHSLIAYLQRRFASSPAKTLTIAKSLASIRPSFIATTKTLNRDDLIFMEKCFQRTLWEYEGFIEGVGTPTIVARRTGEIAAVGKEFEILTGWTKRVLLGRAPNLNVNRGRSPGSSSASGAGSGANTAGRATGVNTPVRPGIAFDGGGESAEKRPQPVFLAELLDDDSVVTFYEDFARLAFGDSRGSVMGRAKLLKYQTEDDRISQNLRREAESRGEGVVEHTLKRSASSYGKQGELKKDGIAGQGGMQKLGSADGKVACTFCWTVKRDVFDIPMLIVMNFLPCI